MRHKLLTPLFILEALVGFSLLVFVHELGHFLAAKWVGVRVEAFSLGIGPCLKKKWGETEYRLSLIPLAGYVKLAGEEPAAGKKPAPDEFYGKTTGQRAIVFVAGVVMNIIFGFVVFVLAYGVGVPVVPAVIGGVEPGSPAWKLGLRRGDRIVGINDITPPLDFEDLRITVALGRRGKPIRLAVLRDGERLEKTIYPEYREDLGMPSVGIYQPSTMLIGERPHKPAPEGEPNLEAVFAAGLREGDRILAIKVEADDAPVSVAAIGDFDEIMSRCGGKPVKIWAERDGLQLEPVSILPQAVGPQRWIGIRYGSNGIAAVLEDSWAQEAGISEGDRIAAVRGVSTPSRTGVISALDSTIEEQADITVIRNGTRLELTVPARSEDELTESALAFDLGMIVDYPLPGYVAARAGLASGDEIIAVNGTALSEPGQLGRMLDDGKGESITLRWRRGGKEMSSVITPQRQWAVAIPWERAQVTVRAGFLRSVSLGTRKALQWIVRIYGTLRSLLSGEVSARHLSGPIAIGYLTYAAAKHGIGMLLYILGVLSVNLGVVNLLPIPVLDGGHILFLGIEKLRGRPVDEKVRAAASYVGLSLLIAVMLLAFWNDIHGIIFR